MATFKSKMKSLAPGWADEIWQKATEMNGGKGADWRLGLAALAITGARPVSLQRGIEFRLSTDQQGRQFVKAFIPGAKIIRDKETEEIKRGQEEIMLAWQVDPGCDAPPRAGEFNAIREALEANGGTLKVKYNADSIATSVRTLSKQIWPRRKTHVSPICYRELFSSNAKAAGIPPELIAGAMGHLSSESQGRYASRPRKSTGAVAPSKVSMFHTVKTTQTIKTHRSPMARFKATQSLKTKLSSKAPGPKPA